MRHRFHWMAPFLLCAAVPSPAQDSPFPVSGARAVFSQAQSLCEADRGRLWGASLCGPIMLVDPNTGFSRHTCKNDSQNANRSLNPIS